MRKVLAAACFGLVLTVAGASSSDDATPEGRAYFGLSFGGERAMPRDFHYGLRLDHDSRFIEGYAPAMMQLDFTTRGLNSAHVNGLNVIRPQYRLRQNDTGAEQPAEAPAEHPAEGVEEVPAEGGEEAADAEQPGFFGRMWQGITGFFGGGDEEEAPAGEATDTAAAEPAPEDPAEEEVTEGMFLNFNAVDWGLLAIGAVGIGYAVGEISNGDESESPGGTTTGGTTTGGSPGGTPLGGTPLGGTPLGLTPLGLTSTHVRDAMDRETLERIEWLDGGTGHMGDLEPHRAN